MWFSWEQAPLKERRQRDLVGKMPGWPERAKGEEENRNWQGPAQGKIKTKTMNIGKLIKVLSTTGLIITACSQNKDARENTILPGIAVKSADFDTVINGKPVRLFNLQNENGMIVQITNYGAIVVSILLPGKTGEYHDLALGYDHIREYLNDTYYFGCIIGRYANRIAYGRFTIDNVTCQLPLNLGNHFIHGGPEHLGSKVWDAKQVKDTIFLHYISPDMESGFPGELDIHLTYALTDNNELEMIYTAETNKRTIISLTNHTYLNMNGEGSGTVLDHIIKINADRIVVVDRDIMPTGELLPVVNTPLDLRKETRIADNIDKDHEQLRFNNGFGHCWVLNKTLPGALTYAASLSSGESDFILNIYTTEPGIQFYTANSFPGTVRGKSGRVYHRRGAVTLEPEHFPDSPNHDNFPSTILLPGENYYQKTVMAFGFVEK